MCRRPPSDFNGLRDNPCVLESGGLKLEEGMQALARGDFSNREWIPLSGWPIPCADLLPYYDRAQTLACVPTYTCDPEKAGYAPEALLPIEHGGMVHRLWQFGVATRSGSMYRRQIGLSSNTGVILNAYVTGLKIDDSETTVAVATASTLEGKKYEVRAKVFVLAAGCLEVPRLLLLSRNRGRYSARQSSRGRGPALHGTPPHRDR